MVPTNFIDLGTRQAVDLALYRLAHKGTIRRLARGIYDYPKMHPVLGPLLPPPDAIAKAIAGRQQARLQPAGAYAANLLGLSEQVPAKVVFLTDGLDTTLHGREPLDSSRRQSDSRRFVATTMPCGICT